MDIRSINGEKVLVTINSMTRLIDARGLDLRDEAAVMARFQEALARPEPQAAAIVPEVVQKRRAKMEQIGQESVRSRDRVFPNLPHVPASRKNQAYDGLLALLYRGRIKDTDMILVRHLKTGEYEEMTVGQLLDEVGDMYLLQLELRKHDRSYRDQVNRIFENGSLSEEEKVKQIEAIEIPEFLDVDEQSKHKVVRRNHG